MGSTPNWDIYYLENGDPQSQITESSVQAGTVETALDQVGGNVESVNNFGVQYFANASARDLALTSPSVGWLTQLDSELFMRRWNGSAWVPYGAAEFKVKPSSVTGVGTSVSNDGTIQFSATDTFTVDGVFTSEFRLYKIDFIVQTASASSCRIRLRTGGVDSTANNPRQWTYNTGTSVSTGFDSNTTISISPTNDGIIKGQIILRGVSETNRTQFSGDYQGLSSAGTTGYLSNYGGMHDDGRAMDGFAFSLSTVTTATGSFAVTGVL